MPMMSDKNEALRLQGWRVWRSSSRDRVIPMTGPGGQLQRIRISEALPVPGVFEGISISDEERQARDEQRRLSGALAEREAVGRPLGVTQHIVYNLVTVVGNPDPVNFGHEEFVIAVAPFDGFLTEMFLQLQGGAVPFGLAFRTSGGQSVFRTRDFIAFVPGFGTAEPDELPVLDLNFTPAPFQLQGLKVPVFAGEQVIARARLGAGVGSGNPIGAGVIGFEGFILGRQGSVAAASQFGSLTSAALTAAREGSRYASALAIEQEKTRRATEVERLKTERAALTLKPGVPSGGFLGNPFQELLLSPQAAQQLASRAPTPKPPPRVRPAPPEPPAGADQTFVSAWNPSFGSIGYLVPDPPRGGKVNVFDNRYTIWDISGKNIGSGPIIPVASDGDIPPGARISPIRGGVAPKGLTPASGPGSTQF